MALKVKKGRGKREPSRKSFGRICHIHNLIKAGRCPNVPLLAEEMEVSMRTVERDIESLRIHFQAPLEYDSFHKRFYYSYPFELPPVRLTEGEAVALVLGQSLMSQYRGTPFSGRIKSALEKISDMLPETVSFNAKELENLISFDIQPPRGDEQQLGEVYAQVADALTARHTLQITYYAATRDKVTCREIDPYHLRYHQGAWYLIAYCHLRSQVRIFALDRIRKLTDTGKTYAIDDSFSAKEFLEDVFGIEMGEKPQWVEIYFDPYQARFIRERIWHESQLVEETADGSIILRLKVSGLGEVKRWVMSFGSHALILKPEELRREVAAECERMAARYR